MTAFQEVRYVLADGSSVIVATGIPTKVPLGVDVTQALIRQWLHGTVGTPSAAAHPVPLPTPHALHIIAEFNPS